MKTFDDLPTWLDTITVEQPYPLVFATISGAHLYGFASFDSDVDMRGVHILPVDQVVGLRHGEDTLQHTGTRHGVELDLATHDLLKFCRLLLKNNGYVAEQLLSPLVVASSPLHQQLVELAPHFLTRHHAHHYLGFAATQWKLFERNGELKPALYTLRVLLTGIRLMRTGQIMCDLRQLWHGHDLPYVPELIAAKREGEHRRFAGIVAAERLADAVTRLRGTLEQAAADTSLPDRATAHDTLHDLIVHARLAPLRPDNQRGSR